MAPLLSVGDLRKFFPVTRTVWGIRRKKVGHIRAVDGVTFEIDSGETFGLVGESGSGKSTLGRTVLRLIEPDGGDILYKGQSILNIEENQLRRLRRDMQIVFQDPSSSLNPRRRIKDIIEEPLMVNNICERSESSDRVKDLLSLVRLPQECAYRRPYALSGGEKQRVAIARALSLSPKFMVLDEPTSSLDVSVQAKIISLLQKLQQELSLTYLFISHDLALVKNVSDFIAVMYLGKFLEFARTDDIFLNPAHPYTNTLLSSMPLLETEAPVALKYRSAAMIDAPDILELPPGCRFASRCPIRKNRCEKEMPELLDIGNKHYVACHLNR
jgi:oligopeptide transport system ATP-binding protein